MQGVLGFENHRIRCIIGIGELERIQEQDLFVDLRVTADMSKAATTDQLEDTIDYFALANLCTSLAQSNRYQLLEKFASDAIDEILERYPAETVWIKIKKPSAIETADYSVVELTKTKE